MIIPAIDLIEGKAVRLLKGDYDKVTYYDDSPLDLVQKYANGDTEVIHVVDLQGARDTKRRQLDLISEMVSVAGVAIQTGGGIRTAEDITDLLAAGVRRLVIGSLAIKEPATVIPWIKNFGAEHIVLALDVSIDDDGNKMLPTFAWQERGNQRLESILDQYLDVDIKHILCTDISRDGTLQGSNTSLYSELQVKYPQLEWQASGGIGNLGDIESVAKTGVSGVIVGKALLDGKFTLGEAQTCWQDA